MSRVLPGKLMLGAITGAGEKRCSIVHWILALILVDSSRRALRNSRALLGCVSARGSRPAVPCKSSNAWSCEAALLQTLTPWPQRSVLPMIQQGLTFQARMTVLASSVEWCTLLRSWRVIDSLGASRFMCSFQCIEALCGLPLLPSSCPSDE